jgi:hypothetical protein
MNGRTKQQKQQPPQELPLQTQKDQFNPWQKLNGKLNGKQAEKTQDNINSVLTYLESRASPVGVPSSVGLLKNQEDGPTPDESDNLVAKNT